MKGAYKALQQEYAVANEISEETIGHLENTVAEAQEEIETLMLTRVNLETRVNELLIELDVIAANEPEQPELESEPLVINLRRQIEKLSLAVIDQERIIQNQDEHIFSLTQKYNAQLKISNEYKAMYERERTLHEACNALLKHSEGRIKGLRLRGTVKNWILVGLGGLAVYGFLVD
jgi:hypothetical protein